MRAVVASTLSLALLTGGCFPDSARHRTIAKVVEGGVTLGGIALLAVANNGSDCMTDVPGTHDQSCEDRASVLSTVGLGMILTGLVGFIVTVSTAPDDKPTVTTTATAPATTPPPAAPTTPPGTTPAAPPASPEPAPATGTP